MLAYCDGFGIVGETRADLVMLLRRFDVAYVRGKSQGATT